MDLATTGNGRAHADARVDDELRRDGRLPPLLAARARRGAKPDRACAADGSPVDHRLGPPQPARRARARRAREEPARRTLDALPADGRRGGRRIAPSARSSRKDAGQASTSVWSCRCPRFVERCRRSRTRSAPSSGRLTRKKLRIRSFSSGFGVSCPACSKPQSRSSRPPCSPRARRARRERQKSWRRSMSGAAGLAPSRSRRERPGRRSSGATRSSGSTPATNAVTHRIGTDGGPCGITAGAGALWVMTNAGNTVQRIDPASATLSATIPVGVGPYDVLFAFGSVWVTNYAARDDPPHRPAATNPRQVDLGLHRLSGWPGRHARSALWVGDASGKTIVRINPRTNRVVRRVATGGASPEWLASRGYFVWAANRLDNSVAKIDERKNRRVALIKRVGRGPVDGGIVAGSVWVPNQRSNTVGADPPVAEPRRRDGARRCRPVRRPRPRERALGRELRRPRHLAAQGGLERLTRPRGGRARTTRLVAEQLRASRSKGACRSRPRWADPGPTDRPPP